MNRKLRKLINDPYLFTRDMVTNRVTDVKRRLPRLRWRRGARRYSVVAAVYGVEKYLEEFFRSMVRQTLSFENHIQLIMVDDGSPDGSAEIIAAWQKKYPRSIRYIKKENGGQASARNLGLQHATGDWVTFVDPDDFVDEEYFERVDRFLDARRADDVALVSCNFIVYNEKNARFTDSHPLRYRFKKGERVVQAPALDADIQLTVNSALFRRDLLRASGIKFDEALRPNFEDAHFANRYVLAAGDRSVGFVPGAKYYYRKRADESSTLDRAWQNRGRFDAVLERGYLDLLREAESSSPDGRAPRWIQRTVLYEVIWYLKRLVNRPEAAAFLSGDEQARFKELLREVVSKLDESVILEFDLAGAWLYHKIGILGLWKDARPSFQHVYVDGYDPIKNQVQLRYFYRGEPELEVFTIEDQEIFPAFAKVRRHDLLGDVFVHERIVWLTVGELSGRLRASIGRRETRVVLGNKIHRDGLPLRDVSRLHGSPRKPRHLDARLERRVARSPLARRMYGDAFLFMDRDTQADDNAEHLYRYVHSNRPDINAFFVLRRTSHDWDRLKSEGFRLLAFGSRAHRIATANARHLISSHAEHYVVAPPSGHEWTELTRPRFTFLQHGVTKDNISGWLNPKNIDCFVTASPAEHESIVADGSPYKFGHREVVLTGFPRHDALEVGARPEERLLVIMPTWRQSLVGTNKGLGNDRVHNPAFYESEFATTWKSLLHSSALRELVETHGYRVQFFPHANIQPYLSWFAPPSFVETVSHRPGESMQDVFRRASVMLTDYSSTAFEMAYLGKPVLYYQFDRDFVFGGGHTTKKGYFEYERDGFGPVCVDEPSLLDALRAMFAAGAELAPEYAERIDRTFAYRDGKSCERTLDAILALDEPHHPNDRSATLLVDAARSATEHRAWSRAERRWLLVLEGPTSLRPPDAELRVIEAKRQLGKIDEAHLRLAELEARGDRGDALQLERAELASAAEDWPRAIALWNAWARSEAAERREYGLVRVAEAHRRSGSLARALEVLEATDGREESLRVRTERAEIASASERWHEALERWETLEAEADAPEHARVRLAEALSRLGHHEQALAAVDSYLSALELSQESARHEREARALRLMLAMGTHAEATPEQAPANLRQAGPSTEVIYIGRAAAARSS